MSTYTNYAHNGLNDALPGRDPDFADKHLDDSRINDLPVRWIGRDKAQVQLQRPLHWSENTLPTMSFGPREYGDNDKSDPAQNWEEE
jgi:hypothetical protein